MPGSGGGLDRDPLPPQLEHRVGFGLRRFEIEERVGRARRGLGGAVPVIQRCGRQVGRGGRGRGTQDAAAESQVERAVHARPGREQRRIPARRVVPDPARSLALALGDPGRKIRGPDDAHPRALSGLIELRRDDPVGDRAEGDEHHPSICHSCGAARSSIDERRRPPLLDAIARPSALVAEHAERVDVGDAGVDVARRVEVDVGAEGAVGPGAEDDVLGTATAVAALGVDVGELRHGAPGLPDQDHDVAAALEQPPVEPDERRELGRRMAGSGQDLLPRLHDVGVGLQLLHESDREALLAAERVVDRGLGDVGEASDVAHRGGRPAPLGEQRAGRRGDPGAGRLRRFSAAWRVVGARGLFHLPRTLFALHRLSRKARGAQRGRASRPSRSHDRRVARERRRPCRSRANPRFSYERIARGVALADVEVQLGEPLLPRGPARDRAEQRVGDARDPAPIGIDEHARRGWLGAGPACGSAT